MPGDELRMAFVLASQTPSSRAEESGSRPPSMKHRSDEVRGAGAWRHRHLEKVWFAHTDARMPDIMMSRSARRTRRRRSSSWDNRHNHVFAKTNGANCPAVRKVPNCSTYRLTGTPGDGVRRHLLREDCGRSSVVVARDLACPRSLAYFSAPGVLYFSM